MWVAVVLTVASGGLAWYGRSRRRASRAARAAARRTRRKAERRRRLLRQIVCMASDIVAQARAASRERDERAALTASDASRPAPLAAAVAKARRDATGLFTDDGFDAEASALEASALEAYARGGTGGNTTAHGASSPAPSRVTLRRVGTRLYGSADTARPRPSDVVQGALGTCGLLSACAVLAEHSFGVTQLFVADADSRRHGALAVRLHTLGAPVVVVVDDLVPCRCEEEDAGGEYTQVVPLFSRCADLSASWVPLLEKAWAKLHGGFSAIVDSLPGEALADLTGAPVEFIPASDPNCFARIAGATSDDPHCKGRGWYVCALLPERNVETATASGLVAGHAYAVLDARVLGGTGERLIKLRNPWGRGEWKGAWADGDTRWSMPATRALSHPIADDGEFWMCLHDFQSFFSGVEVCKAMDGFAVRDSCTLKLRPGTPACARLQLPSRTVVAVGVHQRDLRGRKRARYAGLRLWVIKGNTRALASYAPLRSVRDAHSDFIELDAGTHFVLVESDLDVGWVGQVDLEGGVGLPVGISVYTKGEATLRSGGTDGRALRDECIAAMCRTAGESCPYDFLGVRGAEKMEKSFWNERDVYAWLYTNRSRNLRLVERVLFAFDNIEIAGDADGDEATVIVDPGDSRVLCIQQSVSNKGTRWTCTAETEVSRAR